MSSEDPSAHYSVIIDDRVVYPSRRWVVSFVASSFRIPIIPGGRLLRLSLASSAMLVIICLTFITCSHLIPTSNGGVVAGLALCTGNPCFRGIVPGVTSWKDAIAMFDGASIHADKAYYLDAMSDPSQPPTSGLATIIDDASYAQIAILNSSRRDTVTAIRLDRPLNPAVTVSAIMALYGTPSCVDIYRASISALILHYPSIHFLARFDANHFSPFARILSIVVGDPSENVSSRCDPTRAYKTAQQVSAHLWQGFATLAHYLRAD